MGNKHFFSLSPSSNFRASLVFERRQQPVTQNKTTYIRDLFSRRRENSSLFLTPVGSEGLLPMLSRPLLITGIFNQSLVTGIFPSDWKMAEVSPIFKNGSKSDLNNYRPISVIPTLAKIFEKNYLWPAISISEWKWLTKQRPVWFPLATQHSYCLVGDKR